MDGSDERALEGMFGPLVHFGKLVDRLGLDPAIPLTSWREPLTDRFSRLGVELSEGPREAILNWSGGRPYPTMAACRYTVLSARKTDWTRSSATSMFKWASTKPNGTSGTMAAVEPPAEKKISDGQLLTGHVAEWGEAPGQCSRSRSRLTVLVADPLSGASLLLRAAMKESTDQHIVVDARVCGDTRDLAMAIADGGLSEP